MADDETAAATADETAFCKNHGSADAAAAEAFEGMAAAAEEEEVEEETAFAADDEVTMDVVWEKPRWWPTTTVCPDDCRLMGAAWLFITCRREGGVRTVCGFSTERRDDRFKRERETQTHTPMRKTRVVIILHRAATANALQRMIRIKYACTPHTATAV